MRLILVRHGQTACNVADVWHGWDECELTEEGQAQAEAVAARLAGEAVTAVYSSDSARARQTAQAIGRRHGLEPVTNAAFRERYAGEFEGVPVAEVAARHPSVWEERAANYWTWAPPGGETFRQVLGRSLAGIEELRTRHEGETVVVVSHMSPVRVLISHLAGMPIEQTYELPFPSTGVSIFTLDDTGAHVELLNDAEHTRP